MANAAVQREMKRELKREEALRDKLIKLPRPVFDGFADNPSNCQLSSFWGYPHLAVEICSDRKPCNALVTLYAKLGLHRYNFLHRTNFKLLRVEKYNYTFPMVTTTYYITLLAVDPLTSHRQTFQTQIDELGSSKFALSCYVARRLGDIITGKTRSFYIPNLPEWPPENPFDQFYVLNESELQRHDWVRLYLELAVAASNIRESDDITDDVEIVKVAVDTTSIPDEEGLCYAKNATVYIRYKDSCAARVGMDVDRLAIVRSSFDELSGRFTLESRSYRGFMKPEKERKILSDRILASPSLLALWVSKSVEDRLVLENRNKRKH